MFRVTIFGSLIVLISSGVNLTAQDAAKQDESAGIQAAFSGWLAREVGKRDLVEIIYTYSAQVLPHGRKLMEVEDEGAAMPMLPSIEGIKVRVKLITDGLRFRLDYMPEADGKLRLPLEGHASPYTLFDGKLFATSSGDGGISITDAMPHIGCPLPQEVLELIPARLEMCPVHLWSAFCAGTYTSWFSKAQKLGSISQRTVAGRGQIEATAPSGGEGDEEFVLLQGNPLAPELVESGYTVKGQRVAFSHIEFADYTRVGSWLLPKKAIATQMLNVPLALYGGVEEKYRKIEQKLRNSGMFDKIPVPVYKQEIIIESIVPVNEDKSTFSMPLRPGILVHDRVHNVDYPWGGKVQSLEKQLNKKNNEG